MQSAYRSRGVSTRILKLIQNCGYILLPSTSAYGATETEAGAPVEKWAYIVAVLMLCLLALLFVVVFNWMQRLEKTSYMGRIYADTILDLEYNRRRARVEKKLREGEFDRQAVHDLRKKYQQVKEREPEWPEELNEYWTMMRSDTGGGLGGGQLPYRNTPRQDGTTTDPFEDYASEGGEEPYVDTRKMTVEHKAIYEAYLNQDRAYKKDREVIRQERHAKEREFFEKELEDASEEARKASEREADVDVGVFRGRGPSFVLQFTAVVVIVFLAVLLGVIDKLGEQQIGTLLAAIAGYVLGRSADSEPGRPHRAADAGPPRLPDPRAGDPND